MQMVIDMANMNFSKGRTTLDYSQYKLNWNGAKEGTFTQDERETLISSNNEGTDICTSEVKIINKIVKLYSDQLDVKVLYYNNTDNGKVPTEVKVHIPRTQYFTVRSL